jgi:3-methyladenine DNA glycosylase Tag
MENLKAEFLFCDSFSYVVENRPNELKWAYNCSKEKFKDLTSQTFLSEYTWVVYTAGFDVRKIEKIFPKLRKTFHYFDLDKMAQTRCLNNILKIFKNQNKANWVIKGAKFIKNIGFDLFKELLLKSGVDYLECLPGIGSITKNHLARNIGYASVPKNDIWIMRLTELLGADNHLHLVNYLSDQFHEKAGTVDAILWRFCRDNAWKEKNYKSLDEYISALA